MAMNIGSNEVVPYGCVWFCEQRQRPGKRMRVQPVDSFSGEFFSEKNPQIFITRTVRKKDWKESNLSFQKDSGKFMRKVSSECWY